MCSWSFWEKKSPSLGSSCKTISTAASSHLCTPNETTLPRSMCFRTSPSARTTALRSSNIAANLCRPTTRFASNLSSQASSHVSSWTRHPLRNFYRGLFGAVIFRAFRLVSESDYRVVKQWPLSPWTFPPLHFIVWGSIEKPSRGCCEPCHVFCVS